jgi:hypothetical protein
MSATYLGDSPAGLVAFGGQEDNDFLIKNALLLVEGTQKDNKGRTHEFPAERIQMQIDNTNAAFDSGIEIPLMLDHGKALVGPTGSINKLGWLHSRAEGRVIRERDLPNPKMKDLIGKFGMFAKVYINNYVDQVKKGAIKLLSPGIDLEEERVVEVSAVAFPAIKGPALFTASRHAYFALSYAEVKERKALMGEKRSKVKDNIDTLFQVISDIESTDPNELIGVDPKALKLNAIQGFYKDLLEVFDLDEDEVQQTPQAIKPDNIGAYEDIPESYQEYAEGDTSDRAEFVQSLKKRRRR